MALCAGFGGLELGLRLVFGDAYRTVCVVEREAFAAAGLVALMEAGYLDPAPLWDDVVTFDGRPWRGVVDLISAGLPCQPYSVAGQQRGDADERAIWPEFVRIVRQVRPALVFIENVPPFLAWYRSIGDRLSRLGYEYQAGLFRASEVGAPHRRERLFVLAYTRYDGFERRRERVGWEEHNDSSFRKDADRCDSALADAGRSRRSEVAGGSHRHEVPNAWWAASDDHEPHRRGEVVAHAGDGHLSIAERHQAGRGRTGSPSTSLGHTNGVLGWRVPTGRPDTTGRPSDAVVDADRARLEERQRGSESLAQPTAWPPSPTDEDTWRFVLAVRPDLAPATERGILRVAHRMANRVDRLRGIGNGVVPLVAAHAFCTLAAQAGLPLEPFAPWLMRDGCVPHGDQRNILAPPLFNGGR